MAYTRKTWKLEDPITDVALNNIEEGVAAAHVVLDAEATPTALDANSISAIGVSEGRAKADHVHGIAANGTPATLDALQDMAIGTSNHLARSDHVHPIQANQTPQPMGAGSTLSVGSSAHLARADHVHALPAAVTPSTQNFGDLATIGSSSHVARADHKHGFPSLNLVPTWHEVGASGEPSFQGDWTNVGSPYYNVSFTKDRMGFVHLRGRAHVPNTTVTTTSTIFYLPAYCLPAKEMCFAVKRPDSDGTVAIQILPTGSVKMLAPGPEPVFLDGITFYADGELP